MGPARRDWEHDGLVYVMVRRYLTGETIDQDILQEARMAAALEAQKDDPRWKQSTRMAYAAKWAARTFLRQWFGQRPSDRTMRRHLPLECALHVGIPPKEPDEASEIELVAMSLPIRDRDTIAAMLLTGSMPKAAKLLGISTSAIHQRLTKIRRRVKTRMGPNG